MFGLLDCDRCIGDIVIPWIVKYGFCSIHFTVTLAGMKNVNRDIWNIVVHEDCYIRVPLYYSKCLLTRKQPKINV